MGQRPSLVLKPNRAEFMHEFQGVLLQHLNLFKRISVMLDPVAGGVAVSESIRLVCRGEQPTFGCVSAPKLAPDLSLGLL